MADLEKWLGIELPIIQAPMAGVQGSALAIAVSNAGGLGSLPCAMLEPGRPAPELAAIRARTAKPFNVNFFCHVPPAPDARAGGGLAGGRSHPYYEELGIDAARVAAAPARAPFSAEAADVLDEFAPAVVSFHFGLPVARAAGPGAGDGARRSSPRRPPSRRRSGWRRTASTRSSPRASRRAGIAGSSCRTT